MTGIERTLSFILGRRIASLNLRPVGMKRAGWCLVMVLSSSVGVRYEQRRDPLVEIEMLSFKMILIVD